MFKFNGTRKPNYQQTKNLNYDDYWRHRGLHLRSKFRSRELVFIDWVKENSSVLDIACGNSPVLYELKNKKSCLVEGFDISPLILKEQEKHGILTQAIDITSDNFKLEKEYDYIILSELLEHLPYPENLISKLRNKAKYLIISVPNSAFYRYRIGLMFYGRFFTQWVYHPAEHLRLWSHTDFLSSLDAQGLELVDCQVSDGFSLGPIKLFKWRKNLFGHQICYLVRFKS